MNFTRRSGAVVAVAAVLCLPLVSCGDNSRPESKRAVAAPAGLEKFYNQTPDWGSCASYSSPDEQLAPDLQCARISVPIDYAKPDGPTAKIALSRAKASGTEAGTKIGSLLFNPGGPGVSGLWQASSATGTPVSARFDRIGFDPRGVGASQPAIRCLSPKEADADRADPDIDMSPAGIAEIEQEHRDYAAKCVQNTRDGKALLEHVGTREVVQDMDVIRGVLGDDKLNYVGYSYGTRLGWAYAEKFPDKVRAMVLDGAVGPDQDQVQEALGQSEGFQKVFEAFAVSCAQKPDCPLGQDPELASDVFRKLVTPLQQHPVPTPKDKRGLSYGDAMTGVQQAMYAPSLWGLLTVGLRGLHDGNGDALLLLADQYDGRAQNGSYSNTTPAFRAISCVDGPPLTDRAVVDKLDVDTRKLAPFTDDGHGTGHAPLDLCAFWPVPSTSAPHTLSAESLRSRGLPKLVVVSTTDDPATPYQNGVRLADQLGAALITFRGDQHTVVFGSGINCVDEAVISYLVDLTAPEPRLSCTEKN